MDAEAEVSGLARIFQKLGAPEAQALVMARQLSKRATQRANELGVSRETALQDLLLKVVEGSQGRSPSPQSGPAQP
jgi:predicted RecB family endonuclease